MPPFVQIWGRLDQDIGCHGSFNTRCNEEESVHVCEWDKKCVQCHTEVELSGAVDGSCQAANFQIRVQTQSSTKKGIGSKASLMYESEMHFSESHYHSCSACPDHALQSLLPLGSSRVMNQVPLQRVATGVKPSLLLKVRTTSAWLPSQLKIGLGWV